MIFQGWNRNVCGRNGMETDGYGGSSPIRGRVVLFVLASSVHPVVLLTKLRFLNQSNRKTAKEAPASGNAVAYPPF